MSCKLKRFSLPWSCELVLEDDSEEAICSFSKGRETALEKSLNFRLFGRGFWVTRAKGYDAQFARMLFGTQLRSYSDVDDRCCGEWESHVKKSCDGELANHYV